MKRMLVAGLALISASTSVLAEGLTFVRELVSTNPGMEVIVPYRSLNASKTTLTLRFDVYPLGSTTKLFSSTAKTFTLPAITCPSAKFEDKWDFVVAGSKAGGPNEIIGVSINQQCWENGQEAITTYLYGVNLSAAGKTPWVKTFTNTELWGMEPINADADTAEELMLGIDVEGKAGATIMLVNPASGVTEMSQTSYPYSNTNYSNIQ